MLSSTKTSLILFSIALVLLQAGQSYAARQSTKISNVEIQEICKKAPRPSTCIQILKSEPQTPKVDLSTLAEIILTKAEYNATGTKLRITEYISNTKNPILKKRYEACDKFYNTALAAIQSVRPGDFSDMVYETSMALKSLKQCSDRFAKGPKEPTPLPQWTEYFANLCGVVYGIGNKGSG